MSPSLHRRMRLARRWLGYCVAIALVLAALVVGVASQLLPLAERHPDRIAAWLGERIGRPVAFDAVETRWTRRGPLLGLDNLRLGEGSQSILVGDAEMLISQYAGLLPGRSFTELRLRGLDLTLQRTDDGRWEIRGLPGQRQAQGDPFEALEGLGELQVIGGKLAIVAPGLRLDTRLPRVDMRLRVDGDRVRVGMRAWMQEGDTPVFAAADFERDSGDGRVHAQARQAQLRAWSPLLQAAGVALEGGTGHGEAWARLRGNRVESLLVDGEFTGVALRGTPLATGATPRLRWQRLQARVRWQRIAGGWRLDAQRLQLQDAQGLHALDGLVLAGGDRLALLAPRLDAGPLLAAIALGDRLEPGLRGWLWQARPRATGHDIEIVAGRGGVMRASGRIAAAGFDPVGNAPGMQGLSGSMLGDARGVVFSPDASVPVRFDWPRGFGVPHVARLDGDIAGWREGEGWRVGTAGLQVQGTDFGVAVRGGMWFQGDGTRPWIDLAADVESTAVTTAKEFWIHYLMPPASIRWLDDALQGGRLEDAHALVSGDLDHWPFRGEPGDPARGLFQVRARIDDGTLRFRPDWPAAEHVDADVAFVADGFRLAGKGVIAGVGVRHFEAGIERFGEARLTVRAQGGGDASTLLGLLRQSPLERRYGETLDQLSAHGLAAVTFGLDLPLHEGGGESKVRGDVVLAGARLVERQWKLVFEDVRGRAEYGSGGFVADGLSVRHEGAPGKLSLRAGDGARNARNAFEATLDANLPAQVLLQRMPALAWLQPRVSGRSDWNAQLSLPKAPARGGKAEPGRVRLQSSLSGTTLALPAPLRKASGTSLPASIEASLPLESGEVRVALGKLLGVRARTDKATGVRVVLGTDTVAEPPPPSGLVVTGRAATLDAIDWIALAKGATTGEQAATKPGFPLRGIDVRADRLDMFGARFEDSRVRLAPAPGALVATLDGPGLQGSLRIPDAAGATVSGRFARVHWRTVPNQGSPASQARASASRTPDHDPLDPDPLDPDPLDPAELPPFAITVDALRFNDAALGQAVLRTRPVADGLRIDELHSAAPGQRISVAGDWLGQGTAERTRVEVAVDSADFGALLSGLGYGGQLSRGEGRAVLAARWKGGPSAFSLLELDGRLTLDVRDGQLTEIEPGAGRVLGLLSVAQLPRRLTLDFRDLFARGFAFDSLAGQVRVADARASSGDLRISGPAADIRIAGNADLRAQTFDQTIEVEPRAGNLLTVAGAIAGGPVGAAIGAAANAVLRKPLGELAARTYHVSGPWKDPEVDVVGRTPANTAAADTQPPPPPG